MCSLGIKTLSRLESFLYFKILSLIVSVYRSEVRDPLVFQMRLSTDRTKCQSYTRCELNDRMTFAMQSKTIKISTIDLMPVNLISYENVTRVNVTNMLIDV